MQKFFSLERLKGNWDLLGRFLQAQKEADEKREGNCSRCGISLQGVQKEDMGGADEPSYYVCIPCRDRIWKNRICYVFAGILAIFLVIAVRTWLESR